MRRMRRRGSHQGWTTQRAKRRRRGEGFVFCCVPSSVFYKDGADQYLQWRQLPFLYQVILKRTKNKVLKTRVQMAHGPRTFHVYDVRQINVGIHSKHARENLGHGRFERPREGHVRRSRKDAWIIQLLFHPLQKQAHILLRRDLGGSLVQVLVRPQILVLGPCIHNSAAVVARQAFSMHNPIQQGQLVVGIHRVHGQPFIRVFGGGTGDGGTGDAGC